MKDKRNSAAAAEQPKVPEARSLKRARARTAEQGPDGVGESRTEAHV